MTNVYVANEDGSITSTFHLILFDPHTDTIDTLTAKVNRVFANWKNNPFKKGFLMFDFESRVLVSNNEVISTYKASSPFYIGNLAQLLILSTDYSDPDNYSVYISHVLDCWALNYQWHEFIISAGISQMLAVKIAKWMIKDSKDVRGLLAFVEAGKSTSGFLSSIDKLIQEGISQDCVDCVKELMVIRANKLTVPRVTIQS